MAGKDNDNVGTTVFNFLKIDAGARPMALGGAFTGLADDENSLYYNPAGIVALDGKRFIAGYHNYIFDMQSGFLGYIHPLGADKSLALQVNYLNYGDFIRTDEEGIVPKAMSEAGFRVRCQAECENVDDLSIAEIMSHLHCILNGFLTGSGNKTVSAVSDNNIGRVSKDAFQMLSALVQSTCFSLPVRLQTHNGILVSAVLFSQRSPGPYLCPHAAGQMSNLAPFSLNSDALSGSQIHGIIGNILFIEKYPTPIRIDHPNGHIKGRCLSGAIWSEQPHNAPAFNFKTD